MTWVSLKDGIPGRIVLKILYKKYSATKFSIKNLYDVSRQFAYNNYRKSNLRMKSL